MGDYRQTIHTASWHGSSPSSGMRQNGGLRDSWVVRGKLETFVISSSLVQVFNSSLGLCKGKRLFIKTYTWNQSTSQKYISITRNWLVIKRNKHIKVPYGKNGFQNRISYRLWETALTLSTLNCSWSDENSRSGLINSQLRATLIMSSLPPARPMIAWQHNFSFTTWGLENMKWLNGNTVSFQNVIKTAIF